MYEGEGVKCYSSDLVPKGGGGQQIRMNGSKRTKSGPKRAKNGPTGNHTVV